MRHAGRAGEDRPPPLQKPARMGHLAAQRGLANRLALSYRRRTSLNDLSARNLAQARPYTSERRREILRCAQDDRGEKECVPRDASEPGFGFVLAVVVAEMGFEDV